MSEVGLTEALEGYSFAYLLTVSEQGRAHSVAVQPVLRDGMLHLAGVGTRSRTNATERPWVSLVWPPTDFEGYSLIVDGEATTSGDAVSVAPTRAVFHRPHDHATHGKGGAGCGSDCRPVDLALDA